MADCGCPNAGAEPCEVLNELEKGVFPPVLPDVLPLLNIARQNYETALGQRAVAPHLPLTDRPLSVCFFFHIHVLKGATFQFQFTN